MAMDVRGRACVCACTRMWVPRICVHTCGKRARAPCYLIPGALTPSLISSTRMRTLAI